MINIFSDEPEKELWRELLKYTYEANIERYLKKKELPINEETVNCISGSILQANEYFMAAKETDLQIAPVLLYYGSTNLLYGVIDLLSGKINKIENHGMKIVVPEKKEFIADTAVRFNSNDFGGIHVVARAIGFSHDLTQFGDWKLKEFFDSIAEISDDYARCYDTNFGHIAMLEAVNTPDGKVEKIYFTDDNKEQLNTLLENVEGFKQSYLKMEQAKEGETGRDYYVLRHKMMGEDISERSYSGQRYLKSCHMKKGRKITIPTVLNMYISLFALSSLCRYHPEKWSPFVLKDTTGEKLLIEKLMYYSRRMIPNYAINLLMDEEVQYAYNRYTPKDTVKHVGVHEVKEIVQEVVKNEIDRCWINGNN